VQLTPHESISRETVRRRLAEDKLKPWQKKMWCIPAVDAEFVERMEDVLELYAEPLDPARPVVSFDEKPGTERVPASTGCSAWKMLAAKWATSTPLRSSTRPCRSRPEYDRESSMS
jgi:hypothetical protein